METKHVRCINHCLVLALNSVSVTNSRFYTTPLVLRQSHLYMLHYQRQIQSHSFTPLLDNFPTKGVTRRHMFDARPWKTTTDGISPVGDSNLEYIYPLISAREPDLVLGSRFIYIVLYICKGNYQKLSICILYIWIILWENSGQHHHYLSLEHIEPQNNMICPHKHSYEWVHFKETNVLWIKIDPQLDMSKDDPGFSYLTVKKCPQRSRYTHPYNYIPYTFYTLRLLLVATTHSIPHSIMW